MGTHLSLPSRVLSSGVLLSSHLDANAQLLGNKVIAHFGKDLPFLFKVLAIEKALSIQAHPDKKLAAELHRDRPTIYKGWYRVSQHYETK
jgi:mannose-6-phosphate isomerase